MVEGGAGPSFPVVFFDGEREMDIGAVKVHRNMEYKPFQLMLSQMIGISPNQISIYLVDTSKSQFGGEDRRRTPVTGKVNFALISRQKDCYFLVVLKRTRKSRNRRERVYGVDFAEYLPPAHEFHAPQPSPENLVLLRRDQPFYDQIAQSELDSLNDRLQSLRAQKEGYQMAMARSNLEPGYGSGPLPDPSQGFDGYRVSSPMMATANNERNWNPGYGSGRVQSPNSGFDGYRVSSPIMMMADNRGRKEAFCEGCVNARENIETASFHHCVNDPVVTRFVTRFGPIAPPTRSPR